MITAYRHAMATTATRRFLDPIAWFDAISLVDEPRVGGKGANLGEMTGAGFPVPPGFVVTSDAFIDTMEAGGVRASLIEVAGAIEASSPEELDVASARLCELVRLAGMTAYLRDEIARAYEQLGISTGADAESVWVAVRSSAVGEDSADASFAGMNETFTNVRGIDAVLKAVVDCWASVYGSRVVAYRETKGYRAEPAIAVVVHRLQQLIPRTRIFVFFVLGQSCRQPPHRVLAVLQLRLRRCSRRLVGEGLAVLATRSARERRFSRLGSEQIGTGLQPGAG